MGPTAQYDVACRVTYICKQDGNSKLDRGELFKFKEASSKEENGEKISNIWIQLKLQIPLESFYFLPPFS